MTDIETARAAYLQVKTCTKCGEEKAIAEFTRQMSRCKPCRRDDVNAWRAANPEKVRRMTRNYAERAARRDRARKASTYGLTLIEYDSIMQAADRCESCGSPGGTGNARLVLDHHHGKGRFRGVLCSGCNLAAGHTYDDPARLRLLADYIEARA